MADNLKLDLKKNTFQALIKYRKPLSVRPGSYHFLFNFNPLSGQNVRDLFAVRNSLTCNVPKYLLKSLLRLQQTGIGLRDSEKKIKKKF